jgi:hypothetical protein
MKAVVVITDSEALPEFERAFLIAKDRGFTILPTVFGSGRTGLKAGDRVHPGSSVLLFTVVPDGELEAALAFVREVRDRAGVAAATKIYVTIAEEVA